jgi:MoxR-like ATPase
LGYPALLDEIHILEQQQLRHPITTLKAIVSLEDVLQSQEAIKSVYVSDAIKRYIVELIRATRESGDVYLGSSPRGSLGLFRAGQARAAMHGRDYVLPDDIKVLAEHVLAHRMIVDPAARLRNISGDLIIQEILRSLPVPSGQLGR